MRTSFDSLQYPLTAIRIAKQNDILILKIIEDIDSSLLMNSVV